MKPYLIKYISKELLKDVIEKANNLGYEIITINNANKTVLVHDYQTTDKPISSNAVEWLSSDLIYCPGEFYNKSKDMEKKYELIKHYIHNGLLVQAKGLPRTESEWIELIPILSGDCERKTEWFREVEECKTLRPSSRTGNDVYVHCHSDEQASKFSKFLNEVSLPMFSNMKHVITENDSDDFKFPIHSNTWRASDGKILNGILVNFETHSEADKFDKFLRETALPLFEKMK
jgi:hypothetical protein